jgi:sialate O-acetylesterase
MSIKPRSSIYIVPLLSLMLTSSFGQADGINKCPIDADIWVLAGQSNMQGAGRTPDTLTNEKIWMLNMDDRWMVAQSPLHRIYESPAPSYAIAQFELSGDQDKSMEKTRARFEELREQSKEKPIGGVGPGIYFARHVLENTGRPIALIPCALGGSKIDQWDPERIIQGDSSLYGTMINKINSTGSRIKGLLWIQGESEAMLRRQDTYMENMLHLIDAFREDVGDPDLPVIFVQIGRFITGFPNMEQSWEDIREIQRNVPGKRSNVYTVSGIDLPLDDCIHYSTRGNMRLGRRMAELALTYVYNVPGHGRQIDLESMKLAKDDETGSYYLHVHFSGVTGQLKSAGLPSEFELRFGDEIRIHYVIPKVEFHPNDEAGLKLFLSGLHEDQAQVICGPGTNPYMNITDSLDMPIPCFGPLDIPLKITEK